MNDETLLEVVLWYAAHGLAVHPLHSVVDGACTCGRANCASPGKHPRLADWPNKATSDPETIRGWWAENPDANVGCVPSRSGLIVIDVDPRNGGTDTWRELMAEHGAVIEDTVICETGGGGLHLYYRVNGHSVSKGELGAGVEVKNRANVVMPPSVHPSGNTYGWALGSGPHEREIADLPAALAELLTNPGGSNGHRVASPGGIRHLAAAELHRLTLALAALADRRTREYADWLHVGMALSELPEDVGLRLWYDFSARCPDLYDRAMCDTKWATFTPADGYTLASIFYWADEDSPGWRPAPPAPEEPEWLADGPPPCAGLTQGDSNAGYTPPMGTHPKRTRLLTVSADELLTREWPDPPWLVEGLLPVGMTVLAGRSKVGKSWLCLQLAQAVATGGAFLNVAVSRASVLYLALEDGPRRLQNRMKAQGWKVGRGLCDFLHASGARQQLGALNKGGAHKLTQALKAEGYKLAIIDTFSRLFTGDQNDVSQVTMALGPLQEAAQDGGIGIVLVDHHNKMGLTTDSDPVLAILGSTAKGAVADCIWSLTRERGKAGASLTMVGRDDEDRTLSLAWDGLTKSWQCEGDADAMQLTPIQRLILDAVSGMGDTATCQNVADALGRDKGNTYRQLQEMVNLSMLVRQGVVYRAIEG